MAVARSVSGRNGQNFNGVIANFPQQIGLGLHDADHAAPHGA
jgi:hypothetical protein